MLPSSTHPQEPPSPYLRPAALRSALGCRWGARDPREWSFPAAARWLPGSAPARRGRRPGAPRTPRARCAPAGTPTSGRGARTACALRGAAANAERDPPRRRRVRAAQQGLGTPGTGAWGWASPLLPARGRKRRPSEAASDALARGPLGRGDRSRLESARPTPPRGSLAGTRLGRRSCRPPQTTQFFKWKNDLKRPFCILTCCVAHRQAT